ncbi:MAG: hypothetical protein AAGA68_18480 [Pseudomonadota bacterium]
MELSDLLVATGGDGSAGVVLKGESFNDRVGRAVGAAGDVNGDGLDDFLLRAQYASLEGALTRRRDRSDLRQRSGFPHGVRAC